MAERSTITVRQEVKDRLALAKGDKSWDEFLGEIAHERLDDAIALAERRLEELRTHKARTVSLSELERDIERLARDENEVTQARPRRRSAVDPPHPPKRATGNPGPRRERGAAGS